MRSFFYLPRRVILLLYREFLTLWIFLKRILYSFFPSLKPKQEPIEFAFSIVGEYIHSFKKQKSRYGYEYAFESSSSSIKSGEEEQEASNLAINIFEPNFSDNDSDFTSEEEKKEEESEWDLQIIVVEEKDTKHTSNPDIFERDAVFVDVLGESGDQDQDVFSYNLCDESYDSCSSLDNGFYDVDLD